MSGGFGNPIIGGGGALVYPAIHSPNFVTGSTGWSINKNGSAEFNNLTIRNGTVISGVFLQYSAAHPAKGNLILAFAPVAGGTDSVGNVYPQGFNYGVWDATGALKKHFGIDNTGNLFVVGTNVQYQQLPGNLQSAIMVPSGDTTGVTDTAQIQAFYGNGAKEVHLMPGTYTVKAGQIVLGLNNYLHGSGKTATIIKVLDTTPGAAGIAFTNATGVYQPSQAAGIGHLTIDGTGSTAITHGLIAGDIAGFKFDDIQIQNFTGNANSKGLLLFNQHFFTEQLRGTVTVQNCSVCVGLDVTGAGTGSFDRMDLDVWLKANDGQFGFSLLGGATGAVIEGGRLGIWGNYGAGGLGTGAVLDFEGTGSAILDCQLDIAIECDGAGTGPKTINFGSGHGVIQRSYGVMEFVPAPVVFQASNNNGQIDYNGRISGDAALLSKVNLIDVTTISSGFPVGWSGTIDIKKMGETGLVFINFSLAIANGTVVTNLEVIAGPIASQFFNASANNTVVVWLQGGGLNQAQSILIGNAGNLQVNGPGFTPGGSTAFLTGAAIYSNSY